VLCTASGGTLSPWIMATFCCCVILGCREVSELTSPRGAGVADEPDAVLQWLGRGSGFMEWGCGGEYIYGVSVKPRVLSVWKWNGDRLTRYEDVFLTGEDRVEVVSGKRYALPPPDQWHPVWIAGDRCVYTGSSTSGAPAHVVVTDKDTRAIQREWPLAEGWHCPIIQASATGQFVALCCREDSGAPGRDWDHPRVQVGLIGPEAKEINWVTTLVGRRSGCDITVRSVVPSNDGTYVAVAGWDNALAMIDVAARETLWIEKPGGRDPLYAVFSPDSQVAYVGGAEGAVYAVNVQTGKPCSRWYATLSGQEEYGHRISCLAVSPDGRWVAAGTGPEGLVFVGSTAANKLVTVLNHGGSTVLLVHFSPDSKALASFVPGTIKIWNVARWDQASTSAPAPPARHAATSPLPTSGPSPRP
jgi:hypothetical protein